MKKSCAWKAECDEHQCMFWDRVYGTCAMVRWLQNEI